MRCKRCGGNKRVQGLGFIEITCPMCKGTGETFESKKLEIIEEEPEQEQEQEQVYKKRGRKRVNYD